MHSTTPDTILSTLAKSPHTMTTAEIVHASGLADRAVRDAIAVLVESGRVVKHRTGRTLHWGLRGQPLPPRRPIVLTADPVKLDAAIRRISIYAGGMSHLLTDSPSRCCRNLRGLERVAEACGYQIVLVPKNTA